MENNNKNKVLALNEMKCALEDLRKSWIKCDYAFGNSNISCNDYITGNSEEDKYPFHLSFDEMATISWIDSCLEKIEDELSK